MTWEACYSAEGWANIRDQIEAIAERADRDNDRESRVWLMVVWAEIQTGKLNPADPEWCEPGFDPRDYKRALRRCYRIAARVGFECIAEDIIAFTEEHAECSNGGHEVYCCPYNCGAHTVSPDPVEVDQ